MVKKTDRPTSVLVPLQTRIAGRDRGKGRRRSAARMSSRPRSTYRGRVNPEAGRQVIRHSMG